MAANQLVRVFFWSFTMLVIFPRTLSLEYEDADGNTAEELTETAVIIGGQKSASLRIWRVDALDRQPFLAFVSKELVLNLTNGDYEVYQGPNISSVYDDYDHNQRMFGLFRRAALWKQKRLSVFEETYIGVETANPYVIKLRIRNFDVLRFAVFLAGIWLFFGSRSVARHSLFYYTAGCSVGVAASMLLAVFVFYKFLPKHSSIAYSVLLGGWSFSLYVLYSIWNNLHTILVAYHKWVAVYLTTVILVSLAVCYRMGPPRNARSLNLCQWTLQAISLMFIYAACQIEPISLGCIAILLTIYNIPPEVFSFFRLMWVRVRPPKRKLLTEEEYLREGAIETELALRQLRDYCASPECKAWKTMSRLKTPVRFAEFVEGSSHLSDNELLNYDEYSFNVDREEDTGSNASSSIMSEEDSDGESVRRALDVTPSRSSTSYMRTTTQSASRSIVNQSTPLSSRKSTTKSSANRSRGRYSERRSIGQWPPLNNGTLVASTSKRRVNHQVEDDVELSDDEDDQTQDDD